MQIVSYGHKKEYTSISCYNPYLMIRESEVKPPAEQAPWKEHTTASASASVFLTDSLGRLLMVRDIDRYGGKWSPIAGFVDVQNNEEPEVAAIREAKEELGLDVILTGLLGVWHYYAEDAPKKPDETSHMHVGYAYTGEILSGTFEMQQDEIQQWGYFSPSEIEELYKDGKLKTPQYNYKGYELWRQGLRYPRSVVQTNGTTKSV